MRHGESVVFVQIKILKVQTQPIGGDDNFTLLDAISQFRAVQQLLQELFERRLNERNFHPLVEVVCGLSQRLGVNLDRDGTPFLQLIEQCSHGQSIALIEEQQLLQSTEGYDWGTQGMTRGLDGF